MSFHDVLAFGGVQNEEESVYFEKKVLGQNPIVKKCQNAENSRISNLVAWKGFGCDNIT
jgi:hypothetical protein